MLAAALFAAVIMALGAGRLSPSVARGFTDSEIESARHTREKYGLDTSTGATLQGLTALELVDVADSRSIPATSGEIESLDLSGRALFEQAVSDELMPFLESLDGYAGAWFDQAHGGKLVVAFTGAARTTEEALRDRMPAHSRGLRIVDADFTSDELLKAYDGAWETWAAVTSVPVSGFAVDYELNALVAIVPPGTDKAVEEDASRIERAVGVRVVTKALAQGRDLACNDRAHCHAPLRAGVQIYGGQLWGTSENCSMGFQITVPSSEVNSSPSRQFLTAGHCGVFENSWYHAGVGTDDKIGSVKNTLYDDTYSRDIMRVSIVPSGERSTLIYGEDATEVMHQPRAPVQGETLCMSMPRYNPNDRTVQGTIICGTVASTSQSWVSESVTPWRTMHGASLDSNDNRTAIGGDSGSPLYKALYQAGGTFHVYPIGIVDHERYPGAGNPGPNCASGDYGCHDIYFAVLTDAFNVAAWDEVVIYTP